MAFDSNSSRPPLAAALLIPGVASLALAFFTQTGCVTKRTVKRDGHVVDEKIVIKRPIKTLIKDIEIE